MGLSKVVGITLTREDSSRKNQTFFSNKSKIKYLKRSSSF